MNAAAALKSSADNRKRVIIDNRIHCSHVKIHVSSSPGGALEALSLGALGSRAGPAGALESRADNYK